SREVAGWRRRLGSVRSSGRGARLRCPRSCSAVRRPHRSRLLSHSACLTPPLLAAERRWSGGNAAAPPAGIRAPHPRGEQTKGRGPPVEGPFFFYIGWASLEAT